MRVICIDTSKPPDYEDEAPFRCREGKVYDVVDTEEEDGVLYYELSFDLGIMYNSKFFIPLSTIDETELVNHKELTV